MSEERRSGGAEERRVWEFESRVTRLVKLHKLEKAQLRFEEPRLVKVLE